MIYANCSKGNGPLVIFIHGWCMNGTCMEPFADVAGALGMATIVPDLPGHGRSRAKKAALLDAAMSIKELAGDNEPILVGYSLGGIVALKYAMRYRISGLFLISSMYEPPLKAISQDPKVLSRTLKSIISLSVDKRTSKYFLRFIQDVLLNGQRPKPSQPEKTLYDFRTTAERDDLRLFFEGLIRTPLSIVHDYYWDFTRPFFTRPANRSPSMVVCGADDAFASLQDQRLLSRKLRCPCRELPDVTHLSIIQARDEIKGMLQTWLSENFRHSSSSARSKSR